MRPETSTVEEVFTVLTQWQEVGWVRPLDIALTRFLQQEGGERDPNVLLLATLASQQLGSGHICLDLDRLSTEPDSLLAQAPDEEPEAPALSEVLAGTGLEGWRLALQVSTVVDGGAGNAPLVLEGNRLYLRRYWQYEQTVAEQIRARLAVRFDPPADLHGRLERLFDAAGEHPNWQKIACALATRAALTVITGGPGTGKTTTVVKLLGLMQSAALENDRPLRIKLAAPTGKAAARLSESIGEAVANLDVDESVRAQIPAQPTTLHKLLGRRPDSRHFRHDGNNPLHADLVVVDEASMIDLEMMASLLDALRPETRLVLLGDKDQLASVEAGAVMGDLCRDADQGLYQPDTLEWLREHSGEDLQGWQGNGGELAQQTTMLRFSHRFGPDSGIGALARAVNEGDARQADTIWNTGYQDLHQPHLKNSHDNQVEQLCVDGYTPYLRTLENERPSRSDQAAVDAWAKSVLAAFTRFQLLCALRHGPAGVDGLNRRIARALEQAHQIPKAEGWYEGRPVMITRNDYQLGLMNGDVGITLAVQDEEDSTRLRVAFQLPDGDIRLVLPSRLDSVDTVYAMTVHKSQGSEFTHTALILPDRDNPVVTRELLYTAITRAKAHFTLLAPEPAVAKHAIQHPTWRASGLAELL